MTGPRPAAATLGDGAPTLAVDLGGSHAACAVVAPSGAVRAAVAVPLDAAGAGGGLAAALPRVAAALGAAAARAGVRPAECRGVAFGFPGLVDPDAGRVLATNEKFADARGVDLGAWARAAFGLPLRLENDARLALLGERAAGAARGAGDVVMLTLGTGVGGAAMIGGRLLRGRHHQAGVLGGHLPVRVGGRRCTCGNVGCVEAEASTWALPALCRAWPGHAESALACVERPDFAALFRAARAGDRVAAAVRDHCLAVWGAGAVALVHAYDPEVVVIGGGVMGSADDVLPAVAAHVRAHAWTPWGAVAVRAAALGGHAALAGAPSLFDA